nr:right-handed parallel beta-helix repeat-containing protein [Paenibacillus sp. YN15]
MINKPSASEASGVIDITAFGVRPDSGEDQSLAVYRAIQHCRSIPGAVLQFPPGRYDFWPELAYEGFFYISNHDNEGSRHVAFPLTGMKDFTLEAAGAEFIFHSLMIPFWVEGSENIRLSGFRVDWEVPMMGQGTVLASEADWFDIAIDEGYRCRVEDGRVVFLGEGWDRQVWGLLEFDPVTQATAYGSADQWSYDSFRDLRAEERSPGVIRYTGNRSARRPADGNKIIFRCGLRDHPAIAISDCTNTVVEDVTVHHALGMGVIAQNSRDVRLHRFHVTLRPGTERVFSTKADATHFVYCSGTVSLTDCLLEYQLDDPCNIHGIYGSIVRRLAPDALLVRLVHGQQQGIGIAETGECLSFVSGKTLQACGSLKLASVERVNAEYMVLVFAGEIPEEVQPGDAVENLERSADVVIRGCTVRRNRARGLLLTTPGSVLVEDNDISAPGAGIKISGDVNFWFESGATRRVVIRNNRFGDCNYAYPSWGKAVIDIDPVVKNLDPQHGYYHGEILIEGNRFRTFDRGLVRGHSVARLVFRDNRAEPSGTYPSHGGEVQSLELRACGQVEAAGNFFAGAPGTLRLDDRIMMLSGEELLPGKG